MLTNNGNQQGLFRGAIMQSGGPIPVGDIEHGQQYFDLMVEKTGCKGSSDTLNCLREVPYNTFKKAMDESPNFFAYQVRAVFILSLNDLAHSPPAGTRAGLVASCRWGVPDGASSTFCYTWPRIQCSNDHRCVQMSQFRTKVDLHPREL
jgi:hypothetical protein